MRRSIALPTIFIRLLSVYYCYDALAEKFPSRCDALDSFFAKTSLNVQILPPLLFFPSTIAGNDQFHKSQTIPFLVFFFVFANFSTTTIHNTTVFIMSYESSWTKTINEDERQTENNKKQNCFNREIMNCVLKQWVQRKREREKETQTEQKRRGEQIERWHINDNSLPG